MVSGRGAFAAGLLIALAGCARTSATRAGADPCAGVGDALASIERARADGALHLAEQDARLAFASCPSQRTRLALAVSLADLGLDDDALEQYRAYQRAGDAAERATAATAIAAIEARPDANRPVSDGDRARARALYAGGINARLTGDYPAALRALRNAYALYPHPLTIVEIARTHRAAGDEAEARRSLARAVAIAEQTRAGVVTPRLPTWQGRTTSAVAYTPDGRRIFSAAAGIVRLWDAGSGRELAAFEAPIAQAQLMPGGDQVIGLYYEDGVPRGFAIFDLNGVEMFRSPPLASSPIRIAMSPDGSEIAASYDDPEGTVDRWGWPGGAPLGTWKTARMSAAPAPGASQHRQGAAPEEPASALAYSADGQRLVVGTYGLVRAFDRRTATQIAVETGPAGQVVEIATGPDGEVAAIDEIGRLTRRLLDAPMGDVTDVSTGALTAVAISRTGRWIATADEGGEIQLWRRGANGAVAVATRFAAHRGSVTDVAFSPDEGWLLSAGSDGALQRWEVGGASEPLQLVQARQPIRALCARGRAFAAGARDRLFVWSDGRQLPVTFVLPDIVEACAFMADGESVLAADRTGSVRSLALGSGRSTELLSVEPASREIFLSHDGAMLGAVSGPRDSSGPRTAALRRTSDGVLLRRFDATNAAALAPDGVVLATGTEEATSLWHVASGARQRTLAAPAELLAFSPDGGALGSGAGMKLLVNELRSPAPAPALDLDEAMTALGWIDSERLWVATGRGTLAVYARADLRRLRSLAGHGDYITNAVRVGGALISAGMDGTIRFWDVGDARARGALYLTAAGDWIAVDVAGHVDGNGLGKDLLSWEVGDVQLPDYAAWDRQHVRGLIEQLTATR